MDSCFQSLAILIDAANELECVCVCVCMCMGEYMCIPTYNCATR